MEEDSWSKIIGILHALNRNNLTDYKGNLKQVLSDNVNRAKAEFGVTGKDIKLYPTIDIDQFTGTDDSITWEYIALNCNLLYLLIDRLGESLANDAVLSVRQANVLKDVFRNLTGIGIYNNLLPNMPQYRNLPSRVSDDSDDILVVYKRLAATTHALIICSKCSKLRCCLLASGEMKGILNSLYQLVFCPLKKPGSNKGDTSSFVMSDGVYATLVNERKQFERHLSYLTTNVCNRTFIRSVMMLMRDNSPPWLKRAIRRDLSSIFLGKNGVETVGRAMIDASVDYDGNDITKTWQSSDVITKMILSFRSSVKFEENLCRQLKDLLKLKNSRGEAIDFFENIFILCVKRLWNVDKSCCESNLIPGIFNIFLYFAHDGLEVNTETEILFHLKQALRLLDACFVESKAGESKVPIELLKPFCKILFHLYVSTLETPLSSTHNDLEKLLVNYLKVHPSGQLFDCLLFDIECELFKSINRNTDMKITHNSFRITKSSFKYHDNTNKILKALAALCKKSKEISISTFLYLLDCLMQKEKYFNTTTKHDLLHLEEANTISNETIQRKVMVYQLMSTLVEDPTIQKYVNENPSHVLRFIEDILQKGKNNNAHKLRDYESDEFQSIFTVVMVLQALASNARAESSVHYRQLVPLLSSLSSEVINPELKKLISGIIEKLTKERFPNNNVSEERSTKSEVDRALEDVFDPSLPVRGHGLITLTKLIQKGDKSVADRKLYILNIFQQNLKSDDSFIYLSAITGLAATADAFPDTVISLLTEEYSDFNDKNGDKDNDLRMKLGEVLVRVIKRLGEMAVKYKTILLNTFLSATKDDDQFIRASSMSNLGEVCRVLGYKLGSIVTEILVCVHAVITTDKSTESRRAAVTVIRQLFTGLGTDTIVFLKDEILEIYRTLKNIYHSDKDDVMRLQAQLALEELNENVKDFVFPKPELQIGKKVVILK